MKKKVFSKSMAWILSVVMLFGVFVILDTTNITVNAAYENPNYNSAVQSYSELQSRLEALKNKYVGTYWTTNGAAADSSGSTSRSYYGKQCNGFAKYIFNDLFCTGSIGSYDSNMYYYPNASGATLIDKSWNFSSSDTNTVKNILSRSSIGDFVQVRRRGKDYGHSMIISGKDDNGIWIFDCNSDGKCGVKNYYQNWATFASKNVGMSLYHSTKYPSQSPSYADIGTDFVATINEVKANKPLKAVNGNIQIGSSNGNADEKWWFIKQSDGSYIIESIINNNYITTGGTDNGSNVTTSKYTGSDSQKWYLYSVNGNFELAPKNSTGQRMNVAGGGTGDGTNIITWQAMSGSTDVQFKINKCGTKYIYNLGTDFVATINDVKVGKPFKAASNGNVELTTSKGNIDEKWWFIRQADGTYIIESLYNNNYITTSGTGNGSNVTTSKYTGSDSQKWYVYPSNGKYELAPKNSTGQRMNIAGGSTNDGTNIITWQEMSGSNDTRFSIVNVGSRYIYNHGTEFVANINDVKVGKPIKSVNGNVELGTSNGGLNEKWYFTRQSDGSYFIKSLSDNNYITVSGGSSNNGTNIITSKYTGGNEQRWYAYPYNNKFELVPKCAMSSRMNLAGGSTNDKTNIALWQEMYGSNDNLFNISNKAALNTIKFTVSYNMNGGSGSISNQTKTYGQDLTLSSTKPTRTGYTFIGWNTSASATTAQYQPSGKYTENSGATLYAIWKANTYTVSYNMNGGSGSIGNQTKTYGQDLTLSSTKPTRTGYDFVGWNTNASATTAQYQAGGKYTANSGATLYAIWKAKQVTVTFYRNQNGSDNTTATQTFTYGVNNQSFSNKNWSKDGHSLLGWSENRNATDKQYSTNSGVDWNWIAQRSPKVTVYAVWKANTYTVSYNMNGGSGSISNQTKTYGQDLTLSSSKPTRTGYAFVGWNTNKDATSAQYAAGGKYTANSGATLYAIWSINKYTVSYNMNGGSGSIINQTKTYGQDLTLSSTKPTRTGYAFVGWNTNKDATTAQYQPGGKYTANSGATLYAIWSINKYTISYNMNGGSGSIGNQTKTYGQDLTLSSTKPTRTGYDFVGWNTNKDATTAQYQPGGKYTANNGATLYAVWKINTWTVSYNMNGGSGSISNQTKTYGQDLTLSSTKPTRTGYDFIGWNTNASATTAQYQPGGKYTANSGATLYAIWSINKYTVSYNMNGGSGSISNQTKTYGQDLTLSSTRPTHKGYDFLGWNTDANATTAQYQPGSKYTVNSGATLYAIWQKVNYDATPDAKSGFRGNVYEFYTQKISWDHAYKFCEKKGGHLVTINSKEENDFVVELTKSSNDSLWMGGRTQDHKTWYWITGEPFDYQNWSEGEPNNYGGNQDVIKLYRSGKWDDDCSSYLHGFICEYDSGIDLSKYEPVYKENYNDHAYWFFEDSVDWRTAKKICEAKGGYLAIPNDTDENSFILSGINNTTKAETWIGVTDIAEEGVWRDVKGSVIKYSNWDNNQPDNYLDREDYAHMYSNGKWNDEKSFRAMYCSLGFVCEFDDLCTANGHNYIDTVVAPTITEQGYTIHTCSVCGHSYKDTYTNKLLNNTSTLSSNAIKLGTPLTVKASATGGTGGYTYAVWYKRSSDSSWTTKQNYSTNATIKIKPASAEKYDISVKVKDSSGTIVKKAFTVNVFAPLKNTTTVSSTSIGYGGTFTVKAKATGGLGDYTYAVYYKKASATKWTTAQNYSSTKTVTIKPKYAEEYDVSVKVKDSRGVVAKKTFKIKVTKPTNTSKVAYTTITLGNTIDITCSATGGSGFYQYAVYYKKSSDTSWKTKQSYSSNTNVSIKPASKTKYDVSVKVKDSLGNVSKQTFTITVK